MGQVYHNNKGQLVIPNELVGTARLVMWSYFFSGHPFNNRYHDNMLEKESKIAFLENETYMAKKRNRRVAFIGGGIGLVAGFLLKMLITN